jgi:hypothetical protein
VPGNQRLPGKRDSTLPWPSPSTGLALLSRPPRPMSVKFYFDVHSVGDCWQALASWAAALHFIGSVRHCCPSRGHHQDCGANRVQDWRGGLLAMLSSQLAKGRFAAPAAKR